MVFGWVKNLFSKPKETHEVKVFKGPKFEPDGDSTKGFKPGIIKMSITKDIYGNKVYR